MSIEMNIRQGGDNNWTFGVLLNPEGGLSDGDFRAWQARTTELVQGIASDTSDTDEITVTATNGLAAALLDAVTGQEGVPNTDDPNIKTYHIGPGIQKIQPVKFR